MKVLDSLTSYQLNRLAPKSFISDHEHLFEFNKEFFVPENSIYEFSRPTVYADGSIFDDNQLFQPSLRLPDEMLKHYTFFKMLKKRMLFKERPLDESKLYVSVNDHWSGEYYHWLIEACSRLVRIQSLLNGKELTLILSNRHKKVFHKESLSLLGIKDVVYLEDKEYCRPKKLVTCDFPGPPDIHRNELIQDLHEKLIQDAPSHSAFKKVYISRQKAPKRKAVNAIELESFLKERGFEVVFAEELSFKEQRHLFAQTNFLISLHGAGLTNILFMNKGSRVIELRKDTWGVDPVTGKIETPKFYHTYYHLCLALGIEYDYLACPSDSNKTSARFADLYVDISQLERIIE